MLPPNLTRHFYETRRAFLQSATGEESTPWFQLSQMERAVVEGEMHLFRQAIAAAEEEQDLLASLNKTTEASAPAVEDTAATDEDTTAVPEDCPCPGCSAVAALLKLMGAPAERLEATLGWDGDSKGRGATAIAFRIVPLDIRSLGAPLSDEEKARAKRAAREAIDRWVAEGKPLQEVTAAADPGPLLSFDARPISVERLLVKDFPFDDFRAEFWTKKPPTADKA